MMTTPDTGDLTVAERLDRGVLVFDGAMGTMLHAAGASLDRCLPELNASRPSLISSIHRAYLAAGADVIETNTFGANRIAMERFGLADSVDRFNRLAVSLAVDVRDELAAGALVAGSIGPAVAPRPAGREVDRAGVAAIVEQAVALEDAGVDLLVFETFSDLAALEAVLTELGSTVHVPIVAQMTFVEDGKTIGGDAPGEVAKRLAACGVVAIGANCTLGPRASRPIVESLVAATTLPVAIQPNAGPPVIVDGRFEYRRNEEYFATTARSFVDLGASIVGGCCGTTPQHIDAMVRAIRSDARRGGSSPVSGGSISVVDRTEGSGLGAALERQGFVVVGSVSPPDTDGADDAVENARSLVSSGADAIIVRSTTRTRASMSPISFGLLLQNRLGIEPVLTASTFDKSLLGLQADLLGAHAFGLKSVICTTGTPPPRGDYPELRRVFDADALDLISALHNLNGAGDAPRATKRPTSFFVGARVNPAAADLEWEVARTKRKLEVGIDFLVTDPIFAFEHFERFVDAIGHDSVPILLGVMALRDFEYAEFLHYEAAGFTLPDEVLERMRDAGGDPGAVGRQIATEIVDAARPYARGVVVSSVDRDGESTEKLIRSFSEDATPD